MCSFAGCLRSSHARGVCQGHGLQLARGEELHPLKPRRPNGSPAPACAFDGCGKPAEARGLCVGHHRQLREGRPLKPLIYQRPDGEPPNLEYRIDENGCHVFTGSLDSDGYGYVSINRKTVRVHRWYWEQGRGPIPAGMVIDHECRNRACCNVKHLRLVTATVNVTENSISPAALNAMKTHCKRGHPLSGGNLIIEKSGNRQCRTCTNARHAVYRLKKRA